MIKITDRINDIRETIVKEGFFKTLDKNQRQFWLSHKTLLTFLWIFLSIMVGEFIIYKHQDVFRSYAISASDLRGGESDCAALEPAVNREQYEKQVESRKNFYQNILSRYASENAVHDEVGDEIKKIMGQKRKNEVSTPVKMAVRPQQATAAFAIRAFSAPFTNAAVAC